MQRVDPQIAEPGICTEAELEAFCELVNQGEEVAVQGLQARVKKAKALVFLRGNGQLVGVAGLKCPEKSYRNKVFRNAGVANAATAFDLELGWVFVPKANRGKGYSKVLSAAALTQNDGQATFATTRADNVPMQRTIEYLGFRRLGDSWLSTRDQGARLVLYVAT